MPKRENHPMPDALKGWSAQRVAEGAGPAYAAKDAYNVAAVLSRTGLTLEELSTATDALQRYHAAVHIGETTSHSVAGSIRRFQRWYLTGSVAQRRPAPRTADGYADPHVAAFEDYLKDMGRAHRTVRAYCNTLQAMADLAGRPARTLDKHMVTALLAQVRMRAEKRGTDVSVSHQRAIRSHASIFAAWLEIPDPCKRMPKLRLVRNHHRAISERTLKILLQHAETEAMSADPAAARRGREMRTVLLLCAFNGLRVSEAGRAVTTDLREQGGRRTLAVRGKGRKGQVPDVIQCSDTVWNDLTLNYELGAGPALPGDKRWSERASNTLNGWAQSRAQVHVTSHQLRAYYATNLYAQTRDPAFVMDQMRHTDFNVTKGYLTQVPDVSRDQVVRDFGAHLLPAAPAEPSPDTRAAR